MNINVFPKEIKNCRCGREHKCDIKEIYIGAGALSEMDTVAANYDTLLVVCDEITYEIAGKAICEKSGFPYIVLSCRPILIPDEKAVNAVIDAAKECGTDHIIGVGSGVINDIAKYASFLLGIRYTIAATAPSMDGYASSAAAMLYGGLKTTFSSHVPEYIIADTEILRNAPRDMLRSGIGDILGKISCLNDWRLANLITGEFLCENIYHMMKESVEQCIANIDGILNREAAACEKLMESLVMAGICMSFIGNSRPASGAEHHMSHFFEITGLLNHTDYLTHGLDVGYSTAITCQLREMLSEADFSTSEYSYEKEENEKQLRRVFGGISDELIRMRDEKELYANRLDSIRQNERKINEILSSSLKYADYKKIFERAGLRMEEFKEIYGEQTIRDCIVYAKDLKDRYTLFRILSNMGFLEQYADKIIKNI